MTSKQLLGWIGLTLGLSVTAGWADQLGDPAKPLTVKEWVKGKPVDVTDGKHIYVIEFCTLSSASDIGITNLSALQQKYRDKGVVAVAVSDELPDQLKDFVKANDARIDYTVACDDLRRTTATYLQAYQQVALPLAFIVGKDGKVLWHGHPLLRLDRALDQIVSGRYDLKEALKSDIATKQMEEYLSLARQANPEAAKAGRMMLEFRTNSVAQLCEMAFVIATDAKLKQPDFALAREALDRAEKLAPSNTFSIALNRAILLSQTGQQQQALARAQQAVAWARTADEKTDAQNCLRTIQARLAAAKANDSKGLPGKP